MEELGAKLKGLFSFKKDDSSKDSRFKGSGQRLGTAVRN